MQPQLIAGRYQALRAIGNGGMGTVWLCRDEVLGREVAVKLMGGVPGESTETERALREARSAAALNHPNAVAVYDVVDHDEQPWLVMEYVEGYTLADEIARVGQLSPDRVADIGAKLASALACAHEGHIVHRDIKPGNVLIDNAGRPKISDFGIARGHGDDPLTQVGFVTGTPGFLSPELARGGDPDFASDVWALGATLYTAVEGRPPYEPRNNPIALLQAIATEPPRPMVHAGALASAIEAMMREDPALRWDMATSAQRLTEIAVGNAISMKPLAGIAGVPGMASPTVQFTYPLAATAPAQSTQRLEAVAPAQSTQRLEAVAPAQSTQRLEAVAPAQSTQRLEAVASAQSTQRLQADGPMTAAPKAARTSGPRVRTLRSPNGDTPAAPSQDDRTTPWRWVPLVLLAMLVVGLGAAYVVSQFGDPVGTGAVAGATPSPTSAKARATQAPPTSAPSETAVAAPPVTGPPAPKAAPTTARTPSNEPAAPDPEANKKLEDFVRSYFSDAPKDPGDTWDRLTPRMKDGAGGRRGYEAFWETIDQVDVNEVRVDAADNSAVAKLTYRRSDGTTSTETHRFSFVTSDGDYLIESDRLG